MTGVLEGQRTFSVEEYHRMGEAGVFGPEERVELIEGVIRQMSPKGKRHVRAVTLASHLLIPALVGRAVVLIQDPVVIPGSDSEPEPDLAILPTANPRDAASSTLPSWIIEVADTSLRFDREDKASLYAGAAIAEYWIVNLADDVLEVLREPRAGQYSERVTLGKTERISPGAFPELDIAVADLLP